VNTVRAQIARARDEATPPPEDVQLLREILAELERPRA
jgi:hypothetical protein